MTNQDNELPIFYTCSICGNTVEMISDTGQPLICCGVEMEPLEAGTTDGAKEKHIPVYEIDGRKIHVTVGSIAHPMLPTHHIAWVEIVTDHGIQRKRIYPGEEPTACFTIGKNESLLAVYAYCNMHGLWVAKCCD